MKNPHGRCKVTEEANTAILAIQSSALKIAEITDGVESLAFQTNMLALNAAE